MALNKIDKNMIDPTLIQDIENNKKHLTDVMVNVTEFGASTTADWQTNRLAFTAANDYVANQGGGKVLVPPGTYVVKGIYQDSNVEFVGNGAILKHPDGMSIDIITARMFITTANSTANSNVITVADATNAKIGAMVAIRGAGKKSVRQNTPITQTISATDTVVTLTKSTGFNTTGHAWIDNELVGWTLSGTTATLQRGLFGTTAAAHSVGAIFYQSMRYYAEILAINGNTLTLNTNVIQTLTSTDVNIGIINPKITGLKFDGQKTEDVSASNNIPVRYPLVKNAKISDSEFINGHLGGLILTQGATACTLENIKVRDCGMPTQSKGAGIWLFQACYHNKLKNVEVTGYCYNGIYIDDRTETATEWDDSCDYNVVDAPKVEIVRSGSNTCFNLTGGNYNHIVSPRFIGGYSGFVLASNQNNNFDNSNPPCTGNLFTDAILERNHIPYSATVLGNILANVKWINTAIPPVDIGSKLINTGADFGAVFYPPGYRWLGANTEITDGTFLNDKMILIPFTIPRSVTLTEVGVEVAAIGNINSATRVGIYNSDIDGLPGTLNWDSGQTIPLDSIGVKYITISRLLSSGTYYLALSFRGASDGIVPSLKVFKQSMDRLPTATRPTSVLASAGYLTHGAASTLSNPANQRGALILVDKLPSVYIKTE